MMDALRINARRDAERTGAKEDVGVRHRAKRVADDEESNILIMSISQDLVSAMSL